MSYNIIIRLIVSFTICNGLQLFNGLIPAITQLNSTIKLIIIIFYILLFFSKNSLIGIRKIPFSLGISCLIYISYFGLRNLFIPSIIHFSIIDQLFVFICLKYLNPERNNNISNTYSWPLIISISTILITDLFLYLPFGISTGFSERPVWEMVTNIPLNGNVISRMGIILILISLEKLNTKSIKISNLKKYLLFLFIVSAIIFIILNQSIFSISYIVIIGIISLINNTIEDNIYNIKTILNFKFLIPYLIIILIIVLLPVLTNSNIISDVFERFSSGGSIGLRAPLLINSFNIFLEYPIFGAPYYEVINSISIDLVDVHRDYLTTFNHTWYVNVLAVYGISSLIAIIPIYYFILLKGFNNRSLYQKLLIVYIIIMPLFTDNQFFLITSILLDNNSYNQRIENKVSN